MIRILELLELLNFPDLPGLPDPKKPFDPTDPPTSQTSWTSRTSRTSRTSPTWTPWASRTPLTPRNIWLCLFFCFICPQHTVITEECGGQQPLPRQGRGQCPDWWQEIQCCQGAIKTEMDSKVYPFFVPHGGRLRHCGESFHILLPQPLTTSWVARFAIKVIKSKSQYSTYLS